MNTAPNIDSMSVVNKTYETTKLIDIIIIIIIQQIILECKNEKINRSKSAKKKKGENIISSLDRTAVATTRSPFSLHSNSQENLTTKPDDTS